MKKNRNLRVSRLFGKNIHKLRRSLKLNQTQFAADLGISKTTLCNYETAKCMPATKVIIKLIEVFGEERVNAMFEKEI